MHIDVCIQTQQMSLIQNEQRVQIYKISTAKNGVGQEYGSEQTPLGWHVIRAKIGTGCQINTVFKKRRPTGEIYSPELKVQHPNRDWILTRILWLSGLEPGRNRLGSRDTMRRYIYIHGTPQEVVLGTPNSKGCIRMHSEEIIEFFDRVEVGLRVVIHL